MHKFWWFCAFVLGGSAGAGWMVFGAGNKETPIGRFVETILKCRHSAVSFSGNAPGQVPASSAEVFPALPIDPGAPSMEALERVAPYWGQRVRRVFQKLDEVADLPQPACRRKSRAEAGTRKASDLGGLAQSEEEKEVNRVMPRCQDEEGPRPQTMPYALEDDLPFAKNPFDLWLSWFLEEAFKEYYGEEAEALYPSAVPP